jgi:hypothetical protein
MIRRFGLALVTCAFSIAAWFVTVGRAQSVPGLDRIQNQAEVDHAGLALFDSYSKCDLEKFESFFADDVEFYHDQGGLTLGNKALTESVKNNICGKTTRELVPGTLKVYYMKGYGMLETGVHRFHHPGHEEMGIGEASVWTAIRKLNQTTCSVNAAHSVTGRDRLRISREWMPHRGL